MVIFTTKYDNASHNIAGSQGQAGARPIAEPGDSGRIVLRKFSGYPTEDPERILSDFEAYCKISGITDTDGRKVAAFQLHLQGPANTWYSCLDEDDKADWDNLVAAFELNYCAENNTPVLLVETETFTNLKLLPHQQIKDYYSHILEKGKKLSKSDQELPAQLAFIVRAGNPSDINAAMTSAKMREAYGYRLSPVPESSNLTVGTVAAAYSSSDNQMINALEKSIQTLCSKLDSLLVQHERSGDNNSSIHERKRSCFACKGQGHIKRVCNWKQSDQITLQHCAIYAHNMDMQQMTANTTRKLQEPKGERGSSLGRSAVSPRHRSRSPERHVPVQMNNCENCEEDSEHVSNSKFLYVQAQFPNCNVSAMLDSGSSINLMSKKLYDFV